MSMGAVPIYSKQVESVGQFGFDELPVEPCDVGDGLVLRAYSLARTRVGAVSESQLLHLRHHGLCALGSLRPSLWQQCELADLRADEEHGRTILASSDASTASDARGAVHRLVGILLGDEDGIGILSLSCAHAGIATSLDDLVESATVHHAVLDDREAGRAPWLHGDDVAILEAAHIELASGGSTLSLSMRSAVDVKGAHATDTFATVMVEDKRLFAIIDKFFVEDVKHLKERGIVRDVLHLVLIEITFLTWTVLTPKLYCKADILSHCS